jgi:tRNA pseudouridine13 synthase
MTIKQSPADFAVEELLSAAVRQKVRDQPGPHALYRLTKEGLTTPAAAAAVAGQLGVRPPLVAFAGLKDRHARTVQHITAAAGLGGGDLPDAAEGPGWRIDRLGWLDEAITAEAIAANRFRITVRDLSRQACDRMDKAARLLAPDAAAPEEAHPDLPVRAREWLTVVNYFGDQRFASARHGRGFIAGHLVRGEFDEALRLAIAAWARKDSRRTKAFKRAVAEGWGRWGELAAGLPRCPQRRAVEHLAASPGDFCGAFAALPYADQELAVHAYQSHLWNATARRLVAERCSQPGPIIAAADPFGEMLFPAAASVPQELAELNLPVLGQASTLREPWRAAAGAVLAEEEITTAMLRIPGLRRPRFAEVPRRLFVAAGGFSMSPPEPDDARPRRLNRILSFDLPRGAYATVVLRALGQ